MDFDVEALSPDGWPDSREERQRFLAGLTRLLAALRAAEGCTTIIGVATEPVNGVGRSHDYVLFELPHPDKPDSATLELAREVFPHS